MRDFERDYDYVPARVEGEWRLPPGLRRALPFYFRRKWVSFGEPIPLFEHLYKTFGRIAHYRFMGTTIVFVNDPEWINEILVAQAGSFVRERTLKRMKILLGEGLITSDDPIHMRQRRIAAPAFHRQRIAGYAEQIVENAVAARDTWSEGAEIDIADEMMHLSLHVVARTLFDSEVTVEVLSVRDEVNTIMGLYNFLVAFPKLESVLHLPIPGVVQFRRARARLDQVVNAMIASRRRLSREELEQKKDLASMLVAAKDEGDGSGMTDTQVRDEILTIFLAGYETVANAMAWTWYLLSQNAECADKMYAEVGEVLGTGDAARRATMEDYGRLRYTEMVFAEAMRLYPPAWAMGRRSTKPVELGEYRLPTGSHFFISQYVMHRSAEFWDEPLEFRPERHTAEAKAVRARFVYFPFGGGGRQCIGEGFAWMEGVLSLATIAQKWRLRFVPRYPVEAQAKITLRPKWPLMMRVEEAFPQSSRS
ncbi:cytochrome P450 [Granulicella sp. 5B5]|uniref:cytochrome P450 n=1 Tax=Granulicella sp. 5B5 TaxID=1617967 RepID=UPI0015F5DB81|nr:cytochrome P450 [Granulicella sp. 5B5]QMV17454.1 cytochrome P450 [Granulicella sp. 5B5]